MLQKTTNRPIIKLLIAHRKAQARFRSSLFYVKHRNF